MKLRTTSAPTCLGITVVLAINFSISGNAAKLEKLS